MIDHAAVDHGIEDGRSQGHSDSGEAISARMGRVV